MGRLYLKSTTATALLFVFVAVFPQRTNSSGLFELDLVSLSNSDGREVSGGCCSGLRSADNSTCPSEDCSVYLRFCITHYQSVVDLERGCTYFEFKTLLLHKRENSAYNVLPQQRVVKDMGYRWEGAFSIIVEAWHPNEGRGHKNLVDRFVGQRAVKVSTEWTNDTLVTSRSSLGIRYRVVCEENYYGDGCERICRPRNDRLGHYTCSSQGEVVCLPGWFSKEDDYCREPLCNPTCKNGQCVDNNNTSECRCQNGWKGPACDICVKPSGCQHGKCETSPLQCLCDEGWRGLFCDLDLNYCTNKKPCLNGGTCTNTAPGSFTCKCPNDFMGKNCELEKNPCRNQPCENGATCNNPSDGQYTCTCSPNYFGPKCDTWANICNDNLCNNGGTCVQDPNGFNCSCPLGYKGIYCEKIDSTNCQVYPCRNGGTCYNSSSGFHCTCPEGVKGPLCEDTIGCSCENGGTCIQQPDGTTICDCPTGYYGNHCQSNDKRCSSSPCENGGTCTEKLDGTTTCECPTGYSGNRCQDDDNRCSSNPCANGATCINLPDGYRCDYCAKCRNGAKCRDSVCECRIGYYGEWCQFGVDVLASNVSHRISREEERRMDTVEIVLVCALSATLVVIIILVFCVVRYVMRRRRRLEEAPPKGKDCDFEEERLQNERNLMHMNNTKCDSGKIVNELAPVAKHSNDAPPKVLNMDMRREPPPMRAFHQKIDNTSGSSISFHSPRACSPCGIYVIEDHLHNDPGGKKKDILATQV